MTYESVLVGQAEMEKFSKSTFSERKIMSTKTSIKRIAAVAAVALTLGGFSAVSANAAINADSLTVASATATGSLNVKATAAVTTSFISAGAGEYTTVTPVLISAPAGNVALPGMDTTTVVTAGTESVTSGVAKLTASSGGVAEYDSGTFNVTLTATVSGTYVVKLIQALSSGTSLVTTPPTITFTIAASAGPSVASSTLTLAAGTAGSGTSTTGIVASKTAPASYASSTTAATIALSLSNAAILAGTNTLDVNNVPAITATVTGAAGVVSWAQAGPVGKSVALAAKTSLTPTLYVFADGNAGTATITFTYTDPVTAASVTLGSKTVTFYGTASKITPSVDFPVIIAGSNPLAISAVVTDSNGTAVANTHVYAVSAATGTISNSYSDCGLSDNTGLVTCGLTGVIAGSTTVTLTLNSTSAGTSTVTTAPLAVRVGSATAATYTISTDKASYLPGELAVVSILMADSKGLPVADSTVIGGALSSTFALAVNNFSATGIVGTATAGTGLGIYTFKVNMPVTSGDVKLTFTPTTTTLAATSVTVTVGGDNASTAAQAAVDAANEATDAANAATDAANNAMDSADAAQQAALDAGDKADAALAAVTDLASKVADIATQISALSSLVSKIAASVAKISAKVKA